MRPAQSFLLGVFALSGFLHAEPSLTIPTKDYVNGTVVNEWAQYTLDTSGNVTVKPGANVTFSAGRVSLYPGFKVEIGGTFKAAASFNPAYNPGGYYTGITPTLSLIGGDQQYGQIDQFNLLPFDIAIWNAAGTAPLVNAPVLITVNSGGGWLSATNGSGAVLTKSLQLITDADGTVHAYFKQGTAISVTSRIQVIAGSENWEFTTFSYETTATTVDVDGDRISDALESALGMNSTQPTRISTGFGLTVFTP